MKLNKCLTFLTPIAIVGVLTPAIVSCSCNKGSSFDINYGDDINCRDKEDKEHIYHKRKTIVKAVKNHAQKEPKRSLSSTDLISINSCWLSDQGKQSFYYDLIASEVITDENEITLFNWNIDADQNNSLSFILNGVEYKSTDTSYIGYLKYSVKTYDDEEKLCISYCIDDLEETTYELCQSYTYSDCYYVEYI